MCPRGIRARIVFIAFLSESVVFRRISRDITFQSYRWKAHFRTTMSLIRLLLLITTSIDSGDGGSLILKSGFLLFQMLITCHGVDGKALVSIYVSKSSPSTLLHRRRVVFRRNLYSVESNTHHSDMLEQKTIRISTQSTIFRTYSNEDNGTKETSDKFD